MPEDNNDINKPHDSGYKFLLSSKKAFIQLIRSFVKTGWAEQIDEASLVKIDKSFILQDFKDKEADLVYRAKLKDKEVIFYVLMELQSTVDYLIPYRLLLYMTEIWRDIFKNVSEKEAKRKSFRLPVIIPIVLYNGQKKWNVPVNFKETLDSYEMFEDQVLNFKYILINVHSFQEEELINLSNLIGSVFLLDRGDSIEENLRSLKRLSDNIEKLEPDEFELFFSWAKNILMRGKPEAVSNEVIKSLEKVRPGEVEEMITNIEKNLQKAWKEAEEKGMEKGMEKGVVKRNIEIAKQMLIDGEPVEKIMKYTGLSKEEIEELK